ncbi:hypothetical protein KIH27_19505 [Mycobacterium sp. M1]|uniref:Uncharacterized protein n=1 Tax=Mycolicibacter acidiphilus TaxID=2835306 RepID=A0ABS5RQI2_9MYCO|nr:hypothetical protein [Mycolicibacter acidiphilus]MBS9535776.1 hypothetical protein [Mycolicibacter acidiphilus]
MTTTVLLVLLLLFAVGVIVNQLFRMRDWLDNAPLPDVPAVDDNDDKSDDG